MRTHVGVHPCMGAVDLVPIYPLGEEVAVEDCAEEARGEKPFVHCTFVCMRVCVSALRNMSLTVELIPYRMCSLAFRAQALLVSRSLFHLALAWDRDEHVLTVLSV